MKNKKAKIEKKLKRGYLPYIDYVIYNKGRDRMTPLMQEAGNVK